MLLPLALAGGCRQVEALLGRGDSAGPARPAGTPAGPAERFRLQPLPVQQAEAYPETCTGLFVSLADFEDIPSGPRGFEQVGRFAIVPPRPGGGRKFVVNITRTGVGALEATVPAGSRLVLTPGALGDFSPYKLLSLAVYSRAVRDDLRVRLTDEAGRSWTSARKLIRTGWNNVLVDIARLGGADGFDPTAVRAVGIGFSDAAGPVWVNLDDVLLIDNERDITPTPAGVRLHKAALDYRLTVPGRGQVALRQHADGLWRFDPPPAQLRLAGAGEQLAAAGEQIELMGRRRVGQVEILEHNRIRLRLANTWYFPHRAGQWPSLAVRTVRWEHTFYGDGRWIVRGEINNAGGAEVSSAAVCLAEKGAWADGRVAERLVLPDFSGEVGRWCCLLPPAGPGGRVALGNYVRPARVRATLAARGVFAPGDAGRDGFDESEGCFHLAAHAGHCRFTVEPGPEGLWNPVFLVAGRWQQAPAVTSEGLAVRPVVRRPDGSVLFLLAGRVTRPTAVEVTGDVPALPGR